MLVKITDARFGGVKVVTTADETGLAEGGTFRLVSMTLPFRHAHLHDDDSGTPCVTGYAANGRCKTARLAEVISL